MYAIYRKDILRDQEAFSFHEYTSLFGCNSGYIPYFLRKNLSANSKEPFSWHLNLEEQFKLEGMENLVLIINLKPNSKDGLISLCEVVDVWGHSDCGWTPIMFYLRGLIVDEYSSRIDDKAFTISTNEVDDPIFSMMYLQGSVAGEDLVGRWTPPGPSPTNSVLLWPDVLETFYQEAKKIIDDIASTTH